MRYSELLSKPSWQRRRLEIMARDEWTCQSCGATDETLHVHHFRYRPGPPWNALDSDLVTICQTCHKIVHSKEPMRWSLTVWGRWLDDFMAMPAERTETARHATIGWRG